LKKKENATIGLALEVPNNGLYFRRMQLLVPVLSFFSYTQKKKKKKKKKKKTKKKTKQK